MSARRKRPLDDGRTNGNGTAKSCAPKYAVLRMQSDEDCLQLFEFALSRGIVDISFVSHPREFFRLVDGGASAEPAEGNSPLTQTALESCLQQSPSDAMEMDEEQSCSHDDKNRLNEQLQRQMQQTQQLNNVFTAMLAAQHNMIPTSTVVSMPPTTLLPIPSAAMPSSAQMTTTSSSPTPNIPSNESTRCHMCSMAVSCKKLANLSLHCLKLHCTVPLWQCPFEGCSYGHADFGKARTHIRTMHNMSEAAPKDNRTAETTAAAQLWLTKCFPTVNWPNYAHEFPGSQATGDVGEKKLDEQLNETTNWAAHIPTQFEYTAIECSACHLKVSLNKRSIEDHINTLHVHDRPYQCTLCKYASIEELKVRVHATLRHQEVSFVNIFRPLATLKPYLYVPELFPDLKPHLPEDEVDQAVRTLNTPVNAAMAFLRSSATPDSATSIAENNATDTGGDVDVKPGDAASATASASTSTPSSSSDAVSLTTPTMSMTSLDMQMSASNASKCAAQLNTAAQALDMINMAVAASANQKHAELPPDVEKFISTLLSAQSNPSATSMAMKSMMPVLPPIKKRRTKHNVDDSERVTCELCQNKVDTKRTMLISHAKTHCQQRQWQCPFCESSASFHSKLKLHIANAHKSDAEPLDLYSPELENQWLVMFRRCFPTHAEQCFKEDWKFRSKQQQSAALDDSLSANISIESLEQPRRSLLLENLPVA